VLSPGLHVVDGRLPGGGEAHDNWLILSKFVAEARGLSVGDEMGREVNEREEGLPYYFQIMAIVDGPTNVSFASLPYLKSRMPSQPNEVLLVIPQPGELGNLNHELLALEGDWEQVRVITYEREVANRDEDFAMFDILIITSVLGLGGVFALMVGLLSLLYYMQRLSEFAVLQAIGYSKWFLLREERSTSRVARLRRRCGCGLVPAYTARGLAVAQSHVATQARRRCAGLVALLLLCAQGLSQTGCYVHADRRGDADFHPER
jgi:hypothetical protein